MTLTQVLKKRKNSRKSSQIFDGAPQKKGVCIKVYSMNPKKPNSAERNVAKIQLSNNKIIIGYIPGEKHNIQEHSVVLVKGGKAKDLPGVKYHLIRGVYDLLGVQGRKTSRSKYGTKL